MNQSWLQLTIIITASSARETSSGRPPRLPCGDRVKHLLAIVALFIGFGLTQTALAEDLTVSRTVLVDATGS